MEPLRRRSVSEMPVDARLRSYLGDLHALQAPGCSSLDVYLGKTHAETLRNQPHQLFVGLAVHRRGRNSSEPRAIAQFFELAGSRIRLHFDLDGFQLVSSMRSMTPVRLCWPTDTYRCLSITVRENANR